MVHEIWMLFVSPAYPDFSAQTSSTGKHYRWQTNKRKYRNKPGSALVEHTNTWAGDMGVNTSKSTLSSHKQANKHIITIHKHKHTDTHWGGKRPRIPRPVSVYLKTIGSCESSQVGLLCMYVGAHKTLLTAVRHFDCPARLLCPKPPNTPTSQQPPPWPDGFFLTVCGLLHLCSTTLNPWDGWSGGYWSSGQMVRR